MALSVLILKIPEILTVLKLRVTIEGILTIATVLQ